MSVASKRNAPSIDSYADNIGFCLHGRNILSVMSTFYVSRHQLVMVKYLGELSRPDLKWFFRVCTAFSALLVQYIWGTVYWYLDWWFSNEQLLLLRCLIVRFMRSWFIPPLCEIIRHLCICMQQPLLCSIFNCHWFDGIVVKHIKYNHIFPPPIGYGWEWTSLIQK